MLSPTPKVWTQVVGVRGNIDAEALGIPSIPVAVAELHQLLVTTGVVSNCLTGPSGGALGFLR